MTRREDPSAAPFWIEDLGFERERLRLGVSQSFLESLATGGVPAAVVGLELAPAGSRLAAGDALGLLHLPDRAIDLRAPFKLRIETTNKAAIADPRLVASSPYARGWLAEVSGE